MAVVASIRITEEANRLLGELAGKLGSPKAQVIEKALRQLEEDMFWREVHDAYDRLASNPTEFSAYRAEHAAWDVTLRDGLPDEKW